MVPVGTIVSLLAWVGGRGGGGPWGLCPKSRAWSIRASLSEVYLAGKLQ